MKKRSSSKNIRKTKYANPVEQQVQLDKHRPLKQVETLTSRLDLLKQQYRQKEHNVIVMQERITQVNGMLLISSSLQQGTTISATIKQQQR